MKYDQIWSRWGESCMKHSATSGQSSKSKKGFYKKIMKRNAYTVTDHLMWNPGKISQKKCRTPDLDVGISSAVEFDVFVEVAVVEDFGIVVVVVAVVSTSVVVLFV